MTTITEAALLAAVIARPDQDGPRLVYADWLDENAGAAECGWCGGRGEDRPPPAVEVGGRRMVYVGPLGLCPQCRGTGSVPDGRAARAEFVRVQVEIARWGTCDGHSQGLHSPGGPRCPECDRRSGCRRRERELMLEHGREWFGDTALATGSEDATRMSPHATIFVVRKGFVSEVRVPTIASWLGGECGRCEGRGQMYVQRHPDGDTTRHGGCLGCSTRPGIKGTGRTPGIGPAVVAAHPVTRVVPADREPHETVFANTPLNHRWMWIWNDGDPANPSSLPERVFRKLKPHAGNPSGADWMGYPSPDAALAALSDALLAAVR